MAPKEDIELNNIRVSIINDFVVSNPSDLVRWHSGVRLKALTECSLTVHIAVNGYLVSTPGRKRRRGRELATLPHIPMALDRCSL